MSNGITFFREKAGITKAELARRMGENRQTIGRLEDGKRKLTIEWAEKIARVLGCAPRDLLFPEMAAVDTKRFSNVFEIANGQELAENPPLSLDAEFLSRLLPSVAKHRLRLLMIDSDQTGDIVTSGDAVIVDIDDNRPARPGLYALEIAGTVQCRYLSPTTSGAIQVQSGGASNSVETVNAEDLRVVGRARLRISTL